MNKEKRVVRMPMAERLQVFKNYNEKATEVRLRERGIITLDSVFLVKS